MTPIYAAAAAPAPNQADAARVRATAIRQARRLRARSLRRRIIAGALAVFVAAWLMIMVALVSGHDPALASKQSAGTSTTTSPSTAGSTTSGSGSSTSGTSSSGAGGVSTHQS